MQSTSRSLVSSLPSPPIRSLASPWLPPPRLQLIASASSVPCLAVRQRRRAAAAASSPPGRCAGKPRPAWPAADGGEGEEAFASTGAVRGRGGGGPWAGREEERRGRGRGRRGRWNERPCCPWGCERGAGARVRERCIGIV
eukprot:764164-Hanusia_phi.AAC.2